MATTERQSNFELYRIILMILIVAHHYVVNSGLIQVLTSEGLSVKSAAFLCFGMWGKTAINSFVLITGYFMCTSQIKLIKVLKLVLEVLFYGVVIYLVFILTGYAQPSLKYVVYALIPVQYFSTNFVSCFILFYLLIPFLNRLVSDLSQQEHAILLCILLAISTVLGSLPFVEMGLNYVVWFCVLYIIASYIRLHPASMFERKPLWIVISIVSILVAMASVVLFRAVGYEPYFLVSDSNKILAVVISVSTFLWVKNTDIKNNKAINWMAASTFGVLLIHANSDIMRNWLWKDIFHNVDHYLARNGLGYAAICVLSVYCVCVLIDGMRRVLIEKPVFILINRNTKEEVGE